MPLLSKQKSLQQMKPQSFNNNLVKDFKTGQIGAVTASHKNVGISGDDDGINLNILMKSGIVIWMKLRILLVWKKDDQFEKLKSIEIYERKDKYGPNGSFTKIVASVEKITNFFKVRMLKTQLKMQNRKILSDSAEDEIDCHIYQINERIHKIQGNLQKTVRIIDDDNMAERHQVWFHEQNYKITPALFKEFIVQELSLARSNHAVFSKGALVASRINLKPTTHPDEKL
ncbi:hypothetical protein C1645_835665 [Glomus cerebriforme]|uniref:Uncharacterized protein n=1 Tax=Glomus cerebriforme TaxID=658196 RepID=A0A397S794_9GLOM|nr:hypothetical protein C1645_835665 [Glomus cerebriforme]